MTNYPYTMCALAICFYIASIGKIECKFKNKTYNLGYIPIVNTFIILIGLCAMAALSIKKLFKK